jgi:hypothetical protein
MPVSVKVGGVWKEAAAVYNKVGGVWKTASDMPVKVGGVWKTGILSSGAYDSIATASPSAGTSYIDFTSIPSTYTHLQIRGIARANDASAGNNAGLYMRFNSDAGSNYTLHFLSGNGSSASAAGLASQTEIFINGANPRGGDTASSYSANIIDILDYANTSKNKTVRALTGDDLNGSGVVRLDSGLWMSTSAITSIRIFLENNFAVNSQLALYGIKGA